MLPVQMVQAAGPQVTKSSFFMEGFATGNFTKLDDLTFINPIGVSATVNQTSGDQIILDNKDESDITFGGKAAIGYRFSNNLILRGTYSYFDEVEAQGDAGFGGTPFRQDLLTKAHAAMLEIGVLVPLGKSFFFEASAGAGVALLDSEGFQGKNRGDDNFFPDRSVINPAFSGGGGIGFNLTDHWSLLLTGDFTYLGQATTDRTDGTESQTGGAINPSEQLEADYQVWRVMAGLRYSF